jgi:hypothetical protein
MVKKQYRNELLELLVKNGNNVTEFELSQTETKNITILHRKTALWFHLETILQHDFSKFTGMFKPFSPSQSAVKFPSQPNIMTDFEGVKRYFSDWTEVHVKAAMEEHEAPDLWEIVKANPLAITSINFSENKPFEIEERKQIQLGLDEIKFLLKQNFDLSQEQLALANQKIDYLKDATDRLNKTDWKGIAISTVFSIAYDLSLSPEKQSMLMGLFSKIWAVIQSLPISHA